ncbi:hypothetical protein [Chryseobacterium paludis]|uniref:hypothetical protein n=1 Tax=Chryseobacterium paludis TaxID=2956784 RepID=UPI0021C007B7|nr:hypothetical protein [Chryseobacterium paludis]
MDKLKKNIFLFLILIFSLSYGQKLPAIEGQYYFGGKQIYLYIFPDNRFVAIGASTVAVGIASIKDNSIFFKTVHPKSEYRLYGRNSSGENRLIITNRQIDQNQIYVNVNTDAANLRLITKNKEDDCNSGNYFIPFDKGVNDLVVKNDADILNTFNVNKAYNDLLLFFLEKEEDLSSFNGIIKIKNGEVISNNWVQKSPLKLGNTTDIEEEKPENILAKFDKIHSVFSQNTIYLDQDYQVILGKVNLNQYSFNKSKNQYERKSSVVYDQKNAIIYEYAKIDQNKVTSQKYIYDRQNSIAAKCLIGSKVLMEKKNKTESNQSNPPLPLEPAPLNIK